MPSIQRYSTCSDSSWVESIWTPAPPQFSLKNFITGLKPFHFWYEPIGNISRKFHLILLSSDLYKLLMTEKHWNLKKNTHHAVNALIRKNKKRKSYL